VTMIYVLFGVSCLLGIVAFGLFVALVIERIIVLTTLRKRLAQGPVTAQELKGFQVQLQAGPIDAVNKIIEATAKLTDSLSKAPMIVVALIASLLFFAIALTAVVLGCKCCSKETPEKHTEARVDLAISHCLVGTFIEGTSQFEGSPQDFPKGCFEDTLKLLRSQPAAVLLIIGHVDLRELNTAPRRIYASNMSLGYQRALAASKLLTGRASEPVSSSRDPSSLAARTVLLAVGASNVRDTGIVAKDRLAADRVADIVTLWNQPVHP
jgi:hypothetical protein